MEFYMRTKKSNKEKVSTNLKNQSQIRRPFATEAVRHKPEWQVRVGKFVEVAEGKCIWNWAVDYIRSLRISDSCVLSSFSLPLLTPLNLDFAKALTDLVKKNKGPSSRTFSGEDIFLFYVVKVGCLMKKIPDSGFGRIQKRNDQ